MSAPAPAFTQPSHLMAPPAVPKKSEDYYHRHQRQSVNGSSTSNSTMEEYHVQKAIDMSLLQGEISTLERENTLLRLQSVPPTLERQSSLEADLANERLLKSRLESEFSQYPGRIFSLERQLEQERATIASLRAQVLESNANANVARLKLENDSYRSRLSIAESNHLVSSNNVQELQSKLEEKAFENAQLKKELEVLQANTLEAEKIQAALRNEIHNMNCQIRASASAAREEKLALLAEFEEAEKGKRYDMVQQATTDEEYFIPNQVDTRSAPLNRPTAPRSADLEVWECFCSADPYHTERLDVSQLMQALASGPWPPLSLATCRLLARCYERTSPFVQFNAFESVWLLVQKLKATFSKYDVTRQSEFEWGHIELGKFQGALGEVGVRVNPKTFETYFQRCNPHSVDLEWDQFVLHSTTMYIWAIEFERVDHDKVLSN